jgi:phosphopantothenoylcysteine decarboxylase/phosphopantothenate--cysteine ligase
MKKRPLTFLISAGPTREAIDPVRYLSNRSSGKMGYALAEAARAAGHRVILVSGPVALIPPRGVQVHPVISAADMLTALKRELPASDVLIMAAAVADWRPRRIAPRKQKKAGRTSWTLDLVPTPDLLATLARRKGRRFVVGFAAETGNPLPEARRKLLAKNLDLIVANDVSRPDAGFEVDTNRVTLLTAHTLHAWPTMTKRKLARDLIAFIESRLPPS